MEIIILCEIIIFVAMAVGSLYTGMKISDYYHTLMQEEIKLALQKQYTRLTAGVDADDPAQPYIYTPPKPQFSLKPNANKTQDEHKLKFAVPPDFMTRLRQNGSASIAVNKPPAYR